MILAILFIIAIIGLDQLSKYWAVTRLAARGTIPIIEDVFHLTYAENRGAAFSMLQDSRWFLIIVTSAAMLFVAYAVWRKWIEGPVAKWGSYCIIAGGIGNLIDRISLGYVVDMFDFRLINFAIFNVADTFICIGGGLLILFLIMDLVPKKKTEPSAESVPTDEENTDAET